MALATLFGFVMIAWDLMVARQAALAPAVAGAPAGTDAKVAPTANDDADDGDEEEEDDDEADESDKKSAQPVWRERLERRMHGGKRRRR
jgi:hypothetical protein